MGDLLETACRQADAAIEKALESPCPVKSRLSPRGTIANPTPRALRLDGDRLAEQISLEHSWLDGVSCEGGFLNFTLGEAWFTAAAERPLPEEEIPMLPPVPVTFPAAIHPEDWVFAGKRADAALCARQDEENAGWLVRITEKRLREVEERMEEEFCWTEGQKQLMLRLASFDENMSEGRMRAYLTDLSRLIWQEKPHRIPAPLNRCCCGVLRKGRVLIYRKFTISEKVPVK